MAAVGSLSYERGEQVEVFFRYTHDKAPGYFPVDVVTQGQFHPCVVKTEGWFPAVIETKWTGEKYDRKDTGSFVKVKMTNPLWFTRQGNIWSDSKYRRMEFAPEFVRKKRNAGQSPYPRPKVSFMHVRWGGKRKVDAVTEGIGGWGQVGSNPSDNFINTLMGDFPYEAFNTRFEVWSAFIQSTHELKDINAAMTRSQMQGEHCLGMYFLWPIGFQDGHEFCGYVNRNDLFKCMIAHEAAGIITRFPHHQSLYTTLASKEWNTSFCLVPGLNTPLTTKISRSMIIEKGYRYAAALAIDALQIMNEGRNNLFFPGSYPGKKKSINKGVAKLGYSWEAMDVTHWSDVIVLPESYSKISIEKIVYTCYESKADNHFSGFNRFDKKECLKNRFQGDVSALDEAERKGKELIQRLYVALRAQCSEMPPVLRFDILARRTGMGQAEVMVGEITELGACFLGWPEGPKTVFRAMMKSAIGTNRQGTWGAEATGLGARGRSLPLESGSQSRPRAGTGNNDGNASATSSSTNESASRDPSRPWGTATTSTTPTNRSGAPAAAREKKREAWGGTENKNYGI